MATVKSTRLTVVESKQVPTLDLSGIDLGDVRPPRLPEDRDEITLDRDQTATSALPYWRLPKAVWLSSFARSLASLGSSG